MNRKNIVFASLVLLAFFALGFRAVTADTLITGNNATTTNVSATGWFCNSTTMNNDNCRTLTELLDDTDRINGSHVDFDYALITSDQPTFRMNDTDASAGFFQILQGGNTLMDFDCDQEIRFRCGSWDDGAAPAVTTAVAQLSGEGHFNVTKINAELYNWTTGDLYLDFSSQTTLNFNESNQNRTTKELLNTSHITPNFYNATGRTFLLQDPTDNLEAATKEYVDSVAGAATATFFLTDSKSNISSYFNLSAKDNGGAESTIDSSALGQGQQQIIFNFTTIQTEPSFSSLSVGVYTLHFHTNNVAGNKPTTVSFQLYNISADGGVENLLMTSDNTTTITATDTAYDLHAVLDEETQLSTGDRILLRIRAHVGATGTDSIVTITQEGNSDSNIAIRTTSAAFDDRFVNIDGDTMTGNLNMGSNLILGSDMSFGFSNLTNYPSACASSQFVTTVGDTLTCASPDATGNSSNEMLVGVNLTSQLVFNEIFSHSWGNASILMQQISDLVHNTTEQMQDAAWGSIGTETNIDVIYQDATNDIDFIVPEMRNTTADIQTAINDSHIILDYFNSTNMTIGESGKNVYYNGSCNLFEGPTSTLELC